MTPLLALALLLAAPRPVPAMTGGIRIHEDDDARWARFVEGAGLDTVQVTFYADQPAWDGGAVEHWRAALDDWPGVEAEVRAARARGLQVMLVLRLKLDRTRAHNRFLWHGMVWPRDDAALERWFADYRAFARWGAERAAELGVELLIVGHELNSMTATAPSARLPDLLHYHLDAARTAPVIDSRLRCAAQADAPAHLGTPDGARFPSLRALLAAEDTTHRGWARRVSGLDAPPAWPAPMPAALAARRARLDAYWRDLAAELRTIYPGPLAYGANFDQFEDVGFWDAMDAIAVSSYFPLRPYDTPPDAFDAVLEAGWRRAAASIERVAQRSGRPVVLHEIGLSRKAGSTLRPYSYDGVEPIERADGSLACVHWASQPDDPTERARGLDALLRVVEAGGFPSLRGVSVWKLTTEPVHRAHETFAVVLPPPHVDRDADDGFVFLTARLAEALAEQAAPFGRAGLPPRGPAPVLLSPGSTRNGGGSR